MDHKYDITALGESLIDFIQLKQPGDALHFIGNAGGAPANLLASASKFGMKCAFIGKVGSDVFGRHLKSAYLSANIDVGSMIFSDSEHTTLTFVSLDESGDRNFFFYRDGTADCMLTKDEVDADTIKRSRIFHFGTLSMTTPCAREATLFAVNTARENGVLVSFDPNYRPSLWNSVNDAKAAFALGSGLSDIIKVSDTELPLLSDRADPEAAAKDILERFGCSLVVVSMGKDGAFCVSRSGLLVRAEAYDVNTVDTTGAGDAFFGAFLSGIIKFGKALGDIEEAELRYIMNMATVCGSLSTANYGAIPAMPTQEEVFDALKTCERTD